MEQQRQLAAIMFTDIVGYTRLMGQSEQKAFAVLAKNREVQLPLIERYNGRFIKELGDGTMASFSNAYDAVRCGIEIQKASASDPDLNLRIGVHMGEVVFENNDVFGDGVNVAARIESAGRTGSVFISDAVYSAVRNKDDIETRFIEQMQLKNVNRPIDIYEVAVDGNFTDADPKSKRTKPSNIGKIVGVGIAIALLLAVAFWFMNGPESSSGKQLEHASIAVLPFENMSSDAENEFFCDGVTEDILTHLSKLKNLKVISRTSVMHYKGSELTLPEIAEQLGVEYIVEGSVRKHNDDVIITAQLIHAGSDGHLWADNFQRKLDDVFAIQSEVAQEITRALNLKISVEEQDGLRTSPTENVEAYEYYLAGRREADDRSEDGVLKAMEHYRKAIQLDPLYVEAYGELAHMFNMLKFFYGYPADSCFALSRASLDEAITIDSNNYRVQTTLGMLEYYQNRDVAKAEYHLKKALDLNPNDPTVYHLYGVLCAWSQRPDKAIELIQKGLELDPYSEILNRNIVYRLTDLDRVHDALDYAEKNARLLGNSREYLNTLIYLYSNDHQWDKALNIIQQYDSLYPEWIGWYGEHIRAKFRLEHNKNDMLERLEYVLENNSRVRNAAYYYFDMCLRFGDYERAERFMNSEKYRSRTDSIWQLRNKCTYAYYTGEYEAAEELYAELRPDYSNRYYCWIKMGREAEVRDTLIATKSLGDYDRSFLYAGLGEVDSALHYFQQIDDWNQVAWARFDPDMEPLWNEPLFKAKVAEYNFPPLNDKH